MALNISSRRESSDVILTIGARACARVVRGLYGKPPDPPYEHVSRIPPSASVHVHVPLQVVSMHAQLGLAPQLDGNGVHVATVSGPIPSLQ